MKGYRGKTLRINLSTSETSVEELNEELARRFIGGAGLGTRLLYDMVDKDTNPLGPHNPLIFMTGPFCGTMVPTGSKASLCARSPYTGLLGYSTFGGHLGADIKFAGYDGIIITGQASKPSYVLVEDGDVEIRDAREIWGLNTEDTWNALKEETGYRNAGVARIGIAGENLVKFASVIVDHYRAAGRTGMGAVMGSKRVKALVVKGTDRKVPVYDDELREYTTMLNDDKREDPTFVMYSDLGTAGYVDMASIMYGSLPAGYYTVSDFDAYDISGTTMREKILVGKSACYRCPIGCGRRIKVEKGRYATEEFAGPELEITGTMGSLILNNNLEALAYVSKQFDLLGVDFISGGNTIAFAYYLFQEGILTASDLDGIEPEWGEVESALSLLEKISKRDGVGDLLAEGSKSFGAEYGVEELAAQVNGLELPQHDPRGFSGMAIAYATSPRGACHMSADMYNVQMGQQNEALDIVSEDRFANEADIAAKQQDFRCVTNSAVICNFYPIKAEELTELVQKVTGWDYSVSELGMTGERIFTLMRLLNLRLGYSTENEKLPQIVMQPLEGPTEGHVPDMDAQLSTWYEYRKWDRKTGKPSTEQLEKLGLDGM
ncbi:aldehyde ferredoxin oxidoreductase [Candidatus Thorarchaeota archaeon]|nr:MAG: aldehyde ferredoxin oxidoreductase [Candidatus Thorarchaeota archaeon]